MRKLNQSGDAYAKWYPSLEAAELLLYTTAQGTIFHPHHRHIFHWKKTWTVTHIYYDNVAYMEETLLILHSVQPRQQAAVARSV
jgi:Na+-transporting NADH:ubiquinone oxidoreductase subunit NqrB